MREIRLYGSEGGGAERLFLPLFSFGGGNHRFQNQGSYHKKVSFQQEYIALLKKHGVEYDPRYVFG